MLSDEEVRELILERTTVVQPGQLMIFRVPAGTSDDDISGIAWTLERAAKGLGIRGFVTRDELVSDVEVKDNG